ncbi:MAG: hypothetical protein GVY12_09065 [Bacteroidetes bacterium]|jgi:hypothetical protein|nr:hypothetical protein [Bacteroidota bacterium]
MPACVRWSFPLLLTLLLAAAPGVAHAQFSGLESQGTNYYTFARPGENTIQILMLGDTGRDGIYEIGEGTDLAEFIALAGGAGESPLGARERQNVTIRLLRKGDDGQRRVIYESSITDLLVDSDYPTLQRDDVLRIRVRRRQVFGWRDALQIVTSASTLILLVDRINRIF